VIASLARYALAYIEYFRSVIELKAALATHRRDQAAHHTEGI